MTPLAIYFWLRSSQSPVWGSIRLVTISKPSSATDLSGQTKPQGIADITWPFKSVGKVTYARKRAVSVGRNTQAAMQPLDSHLEGYNIWLHHESEDHHQSLELDFASRSWERHLRTRLRRAYHTSLQPRHLLRERPLFSGWERNKFLYSSNLSR